MPKLRKNNPGLRFLIDFWSRYCPLEPWHIDWARAHVKVQSALKKDQYLYLEGEAQKNVYLVAKGAVARVRYSHESDKRKILSVALPGMALMTTDHLYSGTPSAGDIIALHPNSIVIEVAYKVLKDFKEMNPGIDTLIDVLGNKKKQQLAKLRLATHSNKPYESYLLFADILPELQQNLTNIESADLLGISVDTVYRAKRILLKK